MIFYFYFNKNKLHLHMYFVAYFFIFLFLNIKIEFEQLDIGLPLQHNRSTVTVQPYCTIGTLTRMLGEHNLQLPVTPEMDQLTVGKHLINFVSSGLLFLFLSLTYFYFLL